MTSEILQQIAKTYGTPVYVYDANKITHQYQQLTQAFKNIKSTIFYACKALTNIHIINHINNIGCNIDCSSINEVKLALHAGFNSARILYTSNSVHFNEIKEAVELGVAVNIDSLSNLEKFAKTYTSTYPVGIRIRPNIMAGGNINISTGHDKSKFGIPLEQLQQVLDLVNTYNLNIETLHIHTGSEIKSYTVWVEVMEAVLSFIHHFPKIKNIDIGGGFKVPYKPTEYHTDVFALGEHLQKLLAQHNLLDKNIWFEPGKFLVCEAGYLLTTVNVIKETENQCFVGVNSGFNHLIRPMFYDAYHKIENISNPTGQAKTYTIVGNICETDTFATDRLLPEIREEDTLCFYNAGAYGFEMSSNFNSRYKPAEVMLLGEEIKLIRTHQSFNDLLANQVPL